MSGRETLRASVGSHLAFPADGQGPGGPTMPHDYKRNGTTTLFAALDVLTGKVIGQCLPRHRHQEYLRSLKKIDREVPKA